VTLTLYHKLTEAV